MATARFIVDAMLGRLARWLRLLGFDVLYVKDVSDDELVALANQEERVLLTKDRKLLREKKVDGHLVEAKAWEDQVREIIDEFRLSDLVRPLSRCLECNQSLEPIEKERVAERVPPLVYQTQNEFTVCPGCRRVYWNGTHVERMNSKLATILEPPEP
jgi:hypothetical protein